MNSKFAAPRPGRMEFPKPPGPGPRARLYPVHHFRWTARADFGASALSALTAGPRFAFNPPMLSRRRVSYARGYLELGLLNEAGEELARLSPGEQETAEVLVLRIAIHQAREDWPSLQAASATLVELQPEEAGGWITWAYATRRADSLAAAEQILLQAEIRHPREGTIQFNLGCYACQRGDLFAARRRVERAIALEASFRELAATDPDLEPLRRAAETDCQPPA